MMNEQIGTTPFGGGGIIARQFLRRKQISETQARLSTADTAKAKAGADKWLVLRALTEAKAAYNLSDRSIAVLEALLSFHPERMLDGSKPLIVFPSNQQLALRTRGMSPATIRRHLSALVEAGLIFRRDSPNGKRYCRRDAHGQPQDMFGFDLAPLALAADAIQSRAEFIRAEEKQRQRLRGEVTLHLRDITKLLQAALNEGRAGDWKVFEARLTDLSGRVARNASMDALRSRLQGLLELRAALEKAYLETIRTDEMSACVCEYEHHIQNPESDQTHESACEVGGKSDPGEGNPRLVPGTKTADSPSQTIPLSRILKSCPQIADYSRNGIGNWAEFMGAVALVRAILKISPAAWNAACATMGDLQAAIAVAAILERAEHIRSPGSYLRALAAKAGGSKSVSLAMVQALEHRCANHHLSRLV